MIREPIPTRTVEPIRDVATEASPDGPTTFPRLDGAMAYALTRELRPARIVEVGSGHSTRFFARAIADGRLATRLTAIDPAPRAAIAGLPVDWLRDTVPDVGMAPFAALASGDFLVIDSSHVLMPGSDVDIRMMTG